MLSLRRIRRGASIDYPHRRHDMSAKNKGPKGAKAKQRAEKANPAAAIYAGLTRFDLLKNSSLR